MVLGFATLAFAQVCHISNVTKCDFGVKKYEFLVCCTKFFLHLKPWSTTTAGWLNPVGPFVTGRSARGQRLTVESPVSEAQQSCVQLTFRCRVTA